MPADASIYGMIRQPEPVNKLAQLAQVMQMQGLQQQGEMNALKMAEFQQGQERKNKLQSLLMGMPADAGDDARINALKGQGFFDEADKLADTITKREKTKAETTTARATALGKYLDFGKQAAGQVFAMPTLENAMSALDQMEQHASALGLPVDAIAKQRQMVSSFTSQDQIKQWAAGQAMQADKLLPQIQTRNLGGTTDTLAVDPLTGAARVTNSVQNTQSPDNKASVQAQMANAAATRDVAAATRDAAKISAESKRVQDTEMKLADDYRTESKGWAETSTAMKKVLTAIEAADKNPGSALAAGTGFMKLLDPNSVVRETELGMALNASGWFDRATNIANTLQNGRTMTATQKKNLRAAAEDLFEEAKAAQREIDAAYRTRAKGYGVDASRVITDRGQNAPRQTPASPRESSGKVTEGPSVFDLADAILRGGR